MMLILISNTCVIALMDGNVVVSETHYFSPKNCFDLINEPLQECFIILFYL